jgi:lipid-A-disaccharide synthase
MVKAAGVPVKIIEGDNYDVMFSADLALATSGTVTLEAALCGLGSVIVYKTSPITAFIARRVINIPNIGLPNIVAGKRILPELLQEEFTPERLQQEALALLEPERNTQMKKDLAYVSERLGEPGAVHRVAELVLRIAEEKQ